MQGSRLVLWVAGHSGGLSRAAPVGGETGAPAKAGGEVPPPDLGRYKEAKDTVLVLGTSVPVGKTETGIRS